MMSGKLIRWGGKIKGFVMRLFEVWNYILVYFALPRYSCIYLPVSVYNMGKSTSESWNYCLCLPDVKLKFKFNFHSKNYSIHKKISLILINNGVTFYIYKVRRYRYYNKKWIRWIFYVRCRCIFFAYNIFLRPTFININFLI